MPLRLTKEGRAFRNTALKIAAWIFGPLIVIRGCMSAFDGPGTPSAAPQQASVAVEQPAPPPNPYPWEDTPLGETLTGPMTNTSGSAMILYIDGKRTVVLDGERVTVTGIVVYDRRHKCKALRLESEDGRGNLVRVYSMLSKPTPASFFDCTPEE